MNICNLLVVIFSLCATEVKNNDISNASHLAKQSSTKSVVTTRSTNVSTTVTPITNVITEISASSTTQISREIISTVENESKNISTNATSPSTPTFIQNNTSEQNVTNNDTNVDEIDLLRGQFDSTVMKQEICTCNLQLNYCDINCCCDTDCSFEKKQIFQFCVTTDFGYVDKSFCRYYEYIYKNNTPFKWERDNNGLFCVVRSNLPSQYTAQISQPIKTIKQLSTYLKLRKPWPNLHDNSELQFEGFSNLSNILKYGNTIWFINKYNEITRMSLPTNFESNLCLLKANVKFLENFVSTCSHKVIDSNNEAFDAYTYFKNVSVISMPRKFEKFRIIENLKKCPSNICLRIRAFICNEYLEDCKNVTENNHYNNFSCNFSLYKNEFFCSFAVKKVFYNFLYNETDGFTDVNLLLHLVNITYSLGNKNFEFIQEFRVNFFWNDRIFNISSKLSGNPGYIFGNPVLMAKKSFQNVSISNVTTEMFGNTSIVSKLMRNSPNIAENFLVLPKNVKGECIFNNNSFELVEFGTNLFTKCSFKSRLNVSINIGNVNQTCRYVQRNIFDLWNINYENVTFFDKYIGNFGNANVNQESDWAEVFLTEMPVQFLNHVYGKIENQQLFCYNFSRNLIIDIFYAKIDVKNLRNQPKILGTKFAFGLKSNYKFNQILPKISNIEIPLEMQVVFSDITGTKKRIFIDPPTFEIKLPKDFFYPFTNSRNYTSKKFAPNVLIFISLLLFLCTLL